MIDPHFLKVFQKEGKKNGKHRANNKCQDDIGFFLTFIG